MPTAAKLVAAIVLAITGYLTADAVVPFLPEGQPVPWLVPVSVFVPIICGWQTLGRLVGKTYWIAINSGLYGVAVSIFYVLLVFSFSEMIKRSTRKIYDGPVDAVVNMFGILTDYALLLLNPPAATTLIVGAVVAGIASEWTNRRWS